MTRLPIGNAFAGTSTFASRFAGKSIAPSNEFTLEMPAILDPGNSRIKRVHARIVKKALLEELRKHHKERIPDHFNVNKQKKYGYKERHPSTILRKERRNEKRADLVRTGRTRREMTARMRTSTSGSAARGDVAAKGVLRFKAGFRATTSKGVTLEQMKDEIRRFTRKEEADVAIGFALRYIQLLDQELTPRIKKRYGSKLRSLGI